jgi:hypothetical protein
MKTSKNLLLVFILSIISLYGCQQSAQEITDVERLEIGQTIRGIMNDLTEAANEHDPLEIMAFCWNSEDYYYVGNGHVFKGWKENYDALLKFIQTQNTNPSQSIIMR